MQPAQKEDGWDTDPFTVVEKNSEKGEKYYYGRGVSDDKGPIVVVYQAIKEFQEEGDLPVNICWLMKERRKVDQVVLKKQFQKSIRFSVT